jgi:rhodanese-related sulfurtransferase
MSCGARPPRASSDASAAPASRAAGRRTIADLVAEARAGLERLSAQEAWRLLALGRIVLVDTRSEDQRVEQGYLPGGVHHPLSVLEWRLDPDAGWNVDPAVTLDSWVVLICREGYSSSLAAARLQALGFARATDVIDGVDGWIAAGLPLKTSPG